MEPVFYSKAQMRSPKNYLLHGIYLACYALVKYNSLPLFNYARYLVLRLFSGGIRSASISEGVTVWFPWRVELGRNSSLNQGVIVDGTGGVHIGEGVRIAPYVLLNTADHEYRDAAVWIKDQGFKIAPIVIEDDVWIGAGAIVNKGVRIGRGSVIGSGAVVTRDIPPYSIAVGVPCRVVKSRLEG